MAETTAPASTIVEGDLLYGAGAIAEFLGLRERQVRHRCEKHEIPYFNIGKTMCSRKTTLMAWLEHCETSAPYSAPAA